MPSFSSFPYFWHLGHRLGGFPKELVTKPPSPKTEQERQDMIQDWGLTGCAENVS